MSSDIHKKFLAMYEAFPFTYKKIAEIVGASENMVARKASQKEYAKYYKFKENEFEKFKNYIKSNSQKF